VQTVAPPAPSPPGLGPKPAAPPRVSVDIRTLFPRRCTRRLFLAALLGSSLIWIAADPVRAIDRERSFDPIPGLVSAPPAGVTVTNGALEGAPPALRRATASAAVHTYTAPDGSRVRVQVSNGYAPDPAADQALVDFLGSLLHGGELDGLKVYVATPSEMPRLCSAIAASCFVIRQDLIVVVGEDSYGGLPTDYVLAHEYGHHIERHRKNLPFRGGSLSWGTKRWSTVERICPGVLAGRYSLDPSGSGYFRNPGEAFAESFAYLHYPGLIPWQWVPSLHPNRAAYRAIRSDVLRPWRHNVRELRRGAVSRGGDRRDLIRFRTPLDGGLSLDLRGRGGADLDLTLINARGKRLRQAAGPGAREHIGYTVCGARRFKARVDAARGAGRYRLLVTRP
jgi:hypothetical protein